MYGYEPPRAPSERGSWAEVLAFILAAFQILFPFLAVVVGGLFVVATMLYIFTVNAWLTLIPLSIVAAGVAALLRRERRRRLVMQARLGLREDKHR